MLVGTIVASRSPGRWIRTGWIIPVSGETMTVKIKVPGVEQAQYIFYILQQHSNLTSGEW